MPTITVGATQTSQPFKLGKGSIITVSPDTATVTYSTDTEAAVRNGLASFADLPLVSGSQIARENMWVKVAAATATTVTIDDCPSDESLRSWTGDYGANAFGDVTGPAASVDSEMVLFSGTTGKSLKRASATGIAVMTSGVVSTVTAPSGTVVGTSDTQTLTNKTISGASNTLTVRLANDVSGTLPVGNGGTGITTGTSGGLMYFSGASTIASSGALTQYGVLYGGGAGAAPSATAVGTAGQVLTSNGAGVAPTFQDGIAMTSLTAASEYDHDNLVLSYSIANSRAEKITYKSLFNRVASLADGTTITPNCEAARQCIHANTQTAGTLTIANPTGTPVDGQQLILRIKSTNAQTYSFGTSYRGGTTALPSGHTGSSKTDYLGFIYNSADSKWDYVALSAGF